MKALQAALRVLREFANDPGRWSVGELAATTGLSKSQVSKILSDFKASGLLVQDPRSKEYSVGLQAVALAGQYLKNDALTREAVGPMRGLVDLTSQTATLCVMHGDEIMYLLAVEAQLYVEHGWKAGSWLPYHCTAAGKVLVANLTGPEIDRIFATRQRPRLTPQTVCDASMLKSQFRQIRKVGLAVTHSEGTPGLGAQAVPVFDQRHAVVAALGLVYPQHLFSEESEAELTRRLHDTARELSHRLGALVYPYGDPRIEAGSKAPMLSRHAKRRRPGLGSYGKRTAGRSARASGGKR